MVNEDMVLVDLVGSFLLIKMIIWFYYFIFQIQKAGALTMDQHGSKVPSGFKVRVGATSLLLNVIIVIAC